VRDGSPPQTNVVHVDGQRAGLMTVLKIGQRVNARRHRQSQDAMPWCSLPFPPTASPAHPRINRVFRASINGVLREAIIAACLPGS